MTADQLKGKSFRGALNYNLEKVKKGVAKWLDTSFTHSNERSVMEEVRMIRVMRPNLAKYFYHTSVNFPPEENLGDEQMKSIAKAYLERMGFDQHQFAIFRHFDADHPHLDHQGHAAYLRADVDDPRDYLRHRCMVLHPPVFAAQGSQSGRGRTGGRRMISLRVKRADRLVAISVLGTLLVVWLILAWRIGREYGLGLDEYVG